MATFTELDALIAKVEGDDGSVGWGEVTIVPGYTHETVESGLAFCLAQAPRLLRKPRCTASGCCFLTSLLSRTQSVR